LTGCGGTRGRTRRTSMWRRRATPLTQRSPTRGRTHRGAAEIRVAGHLGRRVHVHERAHHGRERCVRREPDAVGTGGVPLRAGSGNRHPGSVQPRAVPDPENSVLMITAIGGASLGSSRVRSGAGPTSGSRCRGWWRCWPQRLSSWEVGGQRLQSSTWHCFGTMHGHNFVEAILPGWIISGFGGGLAIPPSPAWQPPGCAHLTLKHRRRGGRSHSHDLP
jgi:hypothetical protein